MINEKKSKLVGIIRELESVVIGLSGGVDSTLIAKLCIDHLDAENVWVVAGDSKSVPTEELEYCKDIASWLKLPADHFTVIETKELENPSYTANPENRCYYCKHELFTKLSVYAKKVGARYIVDGSNVSDLDEYRPGMQAGKELKLQSPFIEAGFTKEDIRALAKEQGLPNWDKPATPCLSSRIPYHSEVTPEKLDQIAAAERCLKSLGFRQFRVRHHGQIARLEVEDFDLILKSDIKNKIDKELKGLGFTYISVDLEEFRSGSLNVELKERK